MTEKQEVFRGHLDECLKHFAAGLETSAPKGTKKATLARKPLADFCGVVIHTASRWLLGTGAPPVGEPLLKLMFFLDVVGYKVIELERMPTDIRNFAELIGFSLLTSGEARSLLGYYKVSRLYEIFRREVGVSSEKKQLMRDEWKKRRGELVAKREKSRALCSFDITPKTKPKLENDKRVQISYRHEAILKIMAGLLALLDEGPFSETQVADLRPHTNTLLRLSICLNALSSRLIVSESGKGGS